MNDREELRLYWMPLTVLGLAALAIAWLVEPARAWWTWGLAVLLFSTPRAAVLFYRSRRRAR